ncbi:MAG: FAD-dependent monooxygenase [Saprospiraceae bacterium]|nr:FAD-dependent monooxygenase [Saprospiraceae bacterium]
MKYTIIGGGIAGLTVAIALKKIGIHAQVFESAATIKPVGAGLMLAANAIKAYQKLGIADKIIARGRLLPSFSILDQRGRTITTANTESIGKKYGLHNFAIHRAELHEALLEELDPTQIILNKKVTGFNHLNDNKINIHFADSSNHSTEILIVADGIRSTVRQQLLPNSKIRYAGYTCWRAVIDNPDLPLHGASETWGKNGRFGIVPLADDKIYWFAVINAPQNNSTHRDYKAKDMLRIFEHFHQPIPAILEHTKDSDLIWNDIIDLKPIQQYAFGNIVLIGDAAHATTPNMGQGACQAIEDAVILADELAKHDQPANAFVAFEKRRMPRTHFIVNTSWNLGKIAQCNNPVLIPLRNALFRLIPKRMNEKQMKTFLEVDF